MKQAVIQSGGKQYLVKEGDILEIEKIEEEKKTEFEPLLVINDNKVSVGQPTVSGAKVTADVVDSEFKGEKVRILKFKAKKRVKKAAGHRQKYTQIKIKEISLKAPAKKATTKSK